MNRESAMREMLFYVYLSAILWVSVRAKQPNCLNQVTKFETVTFALDGNSIGVVDLKKRSCPSSKWTEVLYKSGVGADGMQISDSKAVVPIEELRDQVYSGGVDVYNMINDALIKKFLPAIASDSNECNGISGYWVEEVQRCTLLPGKSKMVNGTIYKANQGLIRNGERVSSYENFSVKISYNCNGNRRGFNSAFRFGGPSVEKCRDEVVFNGNTV
jgi:hypothetical protein